jgi:transcriptional regulator with PAS, ATPase and Fis domain
MHEASHFPHDLPIIVEGETGAGKECAARALHASSRRDGEFVAVNCAALPDHLVESQLFGHRRGAFTGADKASLGYFRAAHRGTLFLDEIQELPIGVQSKLLRAVERREVVAVGETQPTPVDVRIISASQEPLPALVKEGRFRPDLMARLDGLTIVLPPLRARREDVAPLFLEFLRRQQAHSIRSIEPRLIEALCIYDWPLNVRELLLLTRRLAAIRGKESMLRREHLPARLLDYVGVNPVAAPSPSTKSKRSWRPTDSKDEFEALTAALKANRGNVSRAAAAIGISRARAYRLMAANQDGMSDLAQEK